MQAGLVSLHESEFRSRTHSLIDLFIICVVCLFVLTVVVVPALSVLLI